jgi:predicted ribosomally synthesized peptide with SipW-like signal peptide
MSKKRVKQYLMLLTVIGLVSIASGSGTFASFSAETTNPGNTFATGTIVLSNTVNAGTACLSSAGGVNTNINASCDKVFNASVTKPGDSYVGDQLDLQNAGSLAASALLLTAGSCVTSDAAGQSFHGTGNLCPVLDVYVQEWTSNTYSVASHCWYGGGNATTCAFDDTKTLATMSGASPFTLTGGLGAGSHRYFTVGVQLQSGATNTVQGRSAAADLTWHIDQ